MLIKVSDKVSQDIETVNDSQYSNNSTRFLSLFERAHLLVKTRISRSTVAVRADTIILLKLKYLTLNQAFKYMYAVATDAEQQVG